jgi:hypothetical protein
MTSDPIQMPAEVRARTGIYEIGVHWGGGLMAVRTGTDTHYIPKELVSRGVLTLGLKPIDSDALASAQSSMQQHALRTLKMSLDDVVEVLPMALNSAVALRVSQDTQMMTNILAEDASIQVRNRLVEWEVPSFDGVYLAELLLPALLMYAFAPGDAKHGGWVACAILLLLTAFGKGVRGKSRKETIGLMTSLTAPISGLLLLLDFMSPPSAQAAHTNMVNGALGQRGVTVMAPWQVYVVAALPPMYALYRIKSHLEQRLGWVAQLIYVLVYFAVMVTPGWSFILGCVALVYQGRNVRPPVPPAFSAAMDNRHAHRGNRGNYSYHKVTASTKPQLDNVIQPEAYKVDPDPDGVVHTRLGSSYPPDEWKHPQVRPSTSASVAVYAGRGPLMHHGGSSNNARRAVVNRALTTPLEPDPDFMDIFEDEFFRLFPPRHIERCSFDDWVKGARYPRRTVDRLKRAYDALDVTSPSKGSYARQCFVKVEPLSLAQIDDLAEKDPRLIASLNDSLMCVANPAIRMYGVALKNEWRIGKRVVYAAGQPVETLGDFVEHALDQSVPPGKHLVWFEGDTHRFDSAVSTPLLKIQHRMYRACGMTRPGIVDPHLTGYMHHFFRSQLKSYNYMKAGGEFTVNGTRRSGDPDTSAGNTGFTGTTVSLAIGDNHGSVLAMGDDFFGWVFLDEKQEDAFEQRLVDTFARIGFRTAVKLSDHWADLEFCSSRFIRAVSGDSTRIILAPKPGRLLAKMFWVKGQPIDTSTNRGRARMLKHVRGVALGLKSVGMALPFIRPYLQAVLRYTRGIEAEPDYYPAGFRFKAARHYTMCTDGDESIYTLLARHYPPDVSVIAQRFDQWLAENVKSQDDLLRVSQAYIPRIDEVMAADEW